MNTVQLSTLPWERPEEQDALAAEISARWQKAQEGLCAVIYFGALMLDAVRALKGRRRDGVGLKSWLALHCPEVNYKTAMGFKTAALGVVKLRALSQEQTLLEVMEPRVLSPEAEEAREAVFETIRASSLHLLKEAGRLDPGARGGKREGAGRKEGTTAAVSEYDSLKAEAYASLKELLVFVYGGDLEKLHYEDVVQYAAQLRELLAKAEAVAEAAAPVSKSLLEG